MYLYPLEGELILDTGPNPRVFDSVDLGWDLRSCISNKFPGAAKTAGLGSIL